MNTLPNDLINLTSKYLDAEECNLFGSYLNKKNVSDAVNNNDWKFILYYIKTVSGIEELLEFTMYHQKRQLHRELITLARNRNTIELNKVQTKSIADLYRDGNKKIVKIGLAEMKVLVRKSDLRTLSNCIKFLRQS